MIRTCPIRGFFCEAATAIPSLTLIAEYVGAVRTERQVLFSENDSIMNLLQTGKADTSLSLLPDKFANVSRFFSGINNEKKPGS